MTYLPERYRNNGPPLRWSHSMENYIIYMTLKYGMIILQNATKMPLVVHNMELHCEQQEKPEMHITVSVRKDG